MTRIGGPGRIRRALGVHLAAWGVLLWAAPGSLLAQCAMCGAAAEAGDVGRGLAISILFMLGTLFSLAGGVVLLVMRAGRRDTGGRDPVRSPERPAAGR